MTALRQVARRATAPTLAYCFLMASSGEGGQLASGAPPLPVPPAVISRDAAGHATVRAVRLSQPIHVDGRLDEEVYATVPAMSDFIQNDPQEGAPATEKTEVWVLFDRDTF